MKNHIANGGRSSCFPFFYCFFVEIYGESAQELKTNRKASRSNLEFYIMGW